MDYDSKGIGMAMDWKDQGYGSMYNERLSIFTPVIADGPGVSESHVGRYAIGRGRRQGETTCGF